MRRQLIPRLFALLTPFTFVIWPGSTTQGGEAAPERAASIQAAKERLLLIEKGLRELGNNGSADTMPAPQPPRVPRASTPELPPVVPVVIDTSPPTPPPPPVRSEATPDSPLDTGWERLRRIEQGLREVKQGVNHLRPSASPPLPPAPPVMPSAHPMPPKPAPFSLRSRGNYFLFAAPSLAFEAKQDYPLATGDLAELKTGSGLAVNLAFGRRFDAWTLGVELGYRRLPYETFSLPSAGSLSTFAASGDSTSYSLSLHGGRDFPVSPNLSLRTGVSLGIADRRESLTLPVIATTITADGAQFHGSLQTSLEYFFSPRCHLLLGYRFTYLHALSPFDSLPIHQAELGLNWNL